LCHTMQCTVRVLTEELEIGQDDWAAMMVGGSSGEQLGIASSTRVDSVSLQLTEPRSRQTFNACSKCCDDQTQSRRVDK